MRKLVLRKGIKPIAIVVAAAIVATIALILFIHWENSPTKTLTITKPPIIQKVPYPVPVIVPSPVYIKVPSANGNKATAQPKSTPNTTPAPTPTLPVPTPTPIIPTPTPLPSPSLPIPTLKILNNILPSLPALP